MREKHVRNEKGARKTLGANIQGRRENIQTIGDRQSPRKARREGPRLDGDQGRPQARQGDGPQSRQVDHAAARGGRRRRDRKEGPRRGKAGTILLQPRGG